MSHGRGPFGARSRASPRDAARREAASSVRARLAEEVRVGARRGLEQPRCQTRVAPSARNYVAPRPEKVSADTFCADRFCPNGPALRGGRRRIHINALGSTFGGPTDALNRAAAARSRGGREQRLSTCSASAHRRTAPRGGSGAGSPQRRRAEARHPSTERPSSAQATHRTRCATPVVLAP